MKLKFIYVVMTAVVLSGCKENKTKYKQDKSQEKEQVITVIQGHSHNDYEQDRPLFEALDNGFVSVEADVHLINGKLYVTHDIPATLDPKLTLESMYLDPLKAHIQKNNGSVYPNYNGVFYLMVDFKTEAVPTYKKLKEILTKYEDILSIVKNDVEQKGVVKVFISGNRPIEKILKEETKLALLDGRPKDLESNISSLIMPVVSDNYNNLLSWDGYNQLDKAEEQRFKLLVKNTHAQGKVIRLWASPDNENVWRFLLENDVDLINTDLLSDFRIFLLKYQGYKH